MSRAALTRRRAQVASALGRAQAWIECGERAPRNYPANTYPFRASSHFLFLVGRALPGAILCYQGEEWLLFAHPPDADDAIWHGESETLESLSEQTGLQVRPLSEYAEATDAQRLPVMHARGARRELRAGDRPLARAILAARLTHDEEGLQEIRDAVAVSVRAHRAGMRASPQAATEAAVRAAMAHEVIAAKMSMAYGPIVTTRGDILHHERSDGTLREGDLILADVGAESLGGYASDITRTWPRSGRFSVTQRAIYELVLAAQARAIAGCVPGAEYRALHLQASREIAEGLRALSILRGDPEERVHDGTLALFFPHGLGHLLGLDVHDMEDLGDLAGYAPGRTRSEHPSLRYLRLDRPLAPSMVVTIEPGFYQIEALLAAKREEYRDRVNWDELARFSDVRGIRIEDDVLVGEEPVVLSAALEKSADAIEALITR